MAPIQTATRGQIVTFFGLAALIALLMVVVRFGGFVASPASLPFWPVLGLFVAALLATAPRHWWIVVSFFFGVDSIIISASPSGPSVPLKLLPLIVVYYGLIILSCWRFQRRFGNGARLHRLTPDMRDFLVLALVIAVLTGLIDLVRVSLIPDFGSPLTAFQKTLVGNLTSIVIVAPGLLAWLSPPENRRHLLARDSLIEISVLFVLMAIIVGVGLSSLSSNVDSLWQLPQLLFPFALWTAFRFDYRITFLSLLVASVYISAQLVLGYGPYVGVSSEPAMQSLVASFVLTAIAITTLILSSFVATTRRQASDGRQAQAFLDQFSNALDASYYTLNRHEKGLEYLEGVVDSRSFDLQDLRRNAESFLNAVHPEDRSRIENSWKGIRDGTQTRTLDVSYRIVIDSGAEYWQRSLLVPIFEDDGQIIRYVGITYNVTAEETLRSEQRQLREIIHKSDKLHAIGAMGAGLAHDWNNLLFVLSAGTSELEERAGDDPELREIAESFREIVAQGTGITADLLALARRTPEPFRVVDFRNEVNRAIELLQRSLPPNIRIESEGGTLADVMVRVRSSYVHQIVLNLGLNAREAIGDSSGLISIAVDGPFIGKLCGVEQSYTSLTVSDDGPGMTEEVQQHLFEPLFTTKASEGGTGLGLSVVRTLVTEMNGEIVVESRLGHGTTIKLSFPNFAG